MATHMGKFGVDVNPTEVATLGEMHNKGVLDKMRKHLVQVETFKPGGELLKQGSGILFSNKQPLILTCGHLATDDSGKHAAVAYKVKYCTGGGEEYVRPVTPLNDKHDLLVLEGSQCAPSELLAVPTVAVADSVHIAALSGGKLCYSDGKVGSFGSFRFSFKLQLVGYADNGWSGGLVMNNFGNLVGMIQRGVGQSIKQPEAIAATPVHYFLLDNNLPGLVQAPDVGQRMLS